MRSIVTPIAAAAIVLHALLGCCAHHAHAADNDLTPPPVHACFHAHPGHDHGPVSEPAAPAGTDREAPCEDTDCAFLVADKLVVENIDCRIALPLGLVCPASTNVPQAFAVFEIDSGGPSPSSLRTHLLHQVLLN